MVEIRSVRQNVPAPKQSILGGAMRGFGGAVNSINKTNTQNEQRAYDEKQQQAKNTQNLLVALANQGYIVPGPKAKGGGPSGLPEGFAINTSKGDGGVSASQKRQYDMGLGNIPEKYKVQQAIETVTNDMKNNNDYQVLLGKNTREAAMEASQMFENAVQMKLGNFGAIPPKGPNAFLEGTKNLIGQGHKWSPAGMAVRGAGSVAKSFFNKANEKANQKKPSFVSQSAWDSATSSERQALSDQEEQKKGL